ncbi:trace amine-associated receptor 8c-like [Haliotis cracherodii]|uniref:trace amine-associated receptor 8c-like n=1 Tax=Haliotis cracherodii TaxID=6455 RepID=UPI0039EAD791
MLASIIMINNTDHEHPDPKIMISNHTSTNSIGDDYLRPRVDFTPPLAFVIFYNGIVIPVAYIGNLFTYIIVCMMSKYRDSVPDTLIGGLALNDVLTAFVVFTPSIIASIKGEYFNSRVFCEFSAATVVWYIYTTFAIIVLINVERWIAITKPFVYKRMNFTPMKIKAIITLEGLFCLLLASIPLVKYPVRLKAGWYCAITDSKMADGSPGDLYVEEIVYITVILLFIGIIALVGCNISIAYELNQNKLSQPGSKETEKKKKFAKLMGVVALLFLVTWLPNLFANVACLNGVGKCEELEFWAMRIVNMGVAVNPIVYGVMKRTYRRGYIYLLRMTIHYMTCTLIPKPKYGREVFDLRDSMKLSRSLASLKMRSGTMDCKVKSISVVPEGKQRSVVLDEQPMSSVRTVTEPPVGSYLPNTVVASDSGEYVA